MFVTREMSSDTDLDVYNKLLAVAQNRTFIIVLLLLYYYDRFAIAVLSLSVLDRGSATLFFSELICFYSFFYYPFLAFLRI